MKCGEMKAALIDVSPGLLRRDWTSSIFQGIKLCQPRKALNMECVRRGGGGVERGRRDLADTLNSYGMLSPNHSAGFE